MLKKHQRCKVLISKKICSRGVFVVALGLAACDDKPLLDERLLQSQHYSEERSNSLSKAAGHTGLELQKDHQAIFPVTDAAKSYIGRYTVRVDCSDRFARCNDGQADFILTLLEDGTARRSIIHTGNVSFEDNWHYRKDSWFYDELHHQIVLHRESGVEFFYNVTHERNLIMDLNKIINGTRLNREYFAAGNPTPTKAYVLKKVS